MLLAYYIAAINIETVFHAIAGRDDYLPFEGICLTDSFALHEGDDELSFYMKDNTDRRERQKATDIRVIVGNPPYSVGQRSEDDKAKNVAYSGLDQRIRSTYAERSRAGLLQNLYDSYIRAIRWGTDRLGGEPVVQRREDITDNAVDLFAQAYPSETIDREDIFHYIYGLLHSEDYRQRFRANLAKELPRIPCAKSVEDYRAFRDAGKKLGELHVGYESVDPWPAAIDTGGKELPADPEVAYRVTKMRHPGTGRNKDRSTVIYNPHITIRNVPEEAWDYVVNGKPAVQWVMERQCVKTDKASGIVSDANRYAIETVGDPRYPFDLLLRVITVSLETTKIVSALPELAIE